MNNGGQLRPVLVDHLGGHMLFLGNNKSLSVLAINYLGLCMPCPIYYLYLSRNRRNRERHYGTEEFHMEDQSVRLVRIGKVRSRGRWIEPSMKL